MSDVQVITGTSESIPLPDASVDLVMTSPPYWNLKDYGHANQIGAEPYEKYLARLDLVWAECYRVAGPDGVMIVNVANRRHQKRFYPLGIDIASRMVGWTLWDTLIWYVPNALPQPNHYMERLFDSKHESLLVFIKGTADGYTFHKPRVPQKYGTADPRSHKNNPAGRCIGNVVRVPAYRPPNIKEMGHHVAAYPEELVALMVESFTDPGDTVLDPFLGSGTTLKVAQAMGRSGVGVEINPAFLPLIHRRIEEPFVPPDWKTLDILHSATMTPGTTGTRRLRAPRDTRNDV